MSLFTKAIRPTLRLSSTAVKSGGIASIRQKHTLPDLSYDYAELEPSISGKIMEVDGHWTGLVNGC